ncbi:pilus assembly protein PilM [candidate division WWE3 bacterium]|uniref:Pilus assembly protein PilM n=1 Tax=candidate division WWE3 bacterium TaxID=2053526 RepID=A0A955RRR3_UNCKA|nr:pilus assembly protein PilM [candidate division WWE3 bacterium]
MINLALGAKAIGLDISDHTIEAVEVTRDSKGLVVSKRSRSKLKAGIVENGLIKDQESLEDAVLKVFNKTKPDPFDLSTPTVVAIPDDQTFMHLAKLAQDNTTEIAKIAEAEALKNIPIEKDKVVFTYKEIVGPDNTRFLLLVATDKHVLSSWTSFFRTIGLNVDVVDIEPMAEFRGLSVENKEPVCVVDMGHSTTKVSVFYGRSMFYSHSIPIAGNIITQELASNLNISAKSAEQLKITEGLSKPSSQMFLIVAKILAKVDESIVSALSHTQELLGHPVASIVLIGGSSNIKKLPEYFEANHEVNVSIGKPVIAFKQKTTKSLDYIQAIGLALRGIHKHWSSDDIAFTQPEKHDSQKRAAKEDPGQKIRTDKSNDTAKAAPTTKQRQVSTQVSKLTTIFARLKNVVINKRTLVIGLVVVAVLVSLFFGSRLIGGTLRPSSDDMSPSPTVRPFLQEIVVTLPLITSTELSTNGRVMGRKITDQLDSAVEPESQITDSRTRTTDALQPNERLWSEPLNVNKDESTITWLAYDISGIDELIHQEIEVDIGNNAWYEVDSYAVNGLETTENPDVFLLNVAAEINSSVKIEVDES